MALYSTGKTVPELDEAISATADGLLIIHDGEGLKKITITNIRDAITSDVSSSLASEKTRATGEEAKLQAALDAAIERIAALEAKTTETT